MKRRDDGVTQACSVRGDDDRRGSERLQLVQRAPVAGELYDVKARKILLESVSNLDGEGGWRQPECGQILGAPSAEVLEQLRFFALHT